MKKRILYISLLSMLLLVACTDKANPETSLENENPAVSENVSEEVSEEESENESETELEVEEEDTVQAPQYELNPKTYSVEPIGEANPKVVLLTIDDAPDKRALDMAKTLKSLNAPAIFFVNGHFIMTDEKKAILKEIHDMGFSIGNHTKTHANLKKISEEEQREEIISVNNIVEEVTGERPRFFRAPFGVNTDFSRALAKEEGMQLMNWSYGYDYEKEYMTKEKLADIMVNTELLRNGSNLLMHDREWTADALEDIVNGLREKGYEFVDPNLIKGIEEEHE
ncbi:polysaccharide deacetylase family protein [Sporosarcina highlanderae]|uniref:Polysaccharide deacetylase family protein n=1 Tax=Sporosarcina highlanderae TaxID=3035916 RepID=A0ABT8JUY2_9BACL|nr:polysaccharide deacetylase family protein [Sporosarcina highlanderae]MDN4608975.1 polysaccharide deacetylase family protein [Sporosarcina highlanderae]